MADNFAANGIVLPDLHHPLEGSVHVIGPELGLTLPGITFVCGDSQTFTYGRSARRPLASAPPRSSTS